MSVQYSGGCSVQWRLFSTVEAVQYSGGCQVRWRAKSVQWRHSIKFLWGANISTVEAVQYGGGLASVQWRDNMMIVGVQH